MSRADFGIPLIQLKRHNAVVHLIGEIERGLTPALARHPARFIFREQLHEADPTKCAVCTVPLIGRQRHFCSGHWDYAIADVKLNQPYGRVLKSLAMWLRENLQNPRITRHSHYWLGVLKGAFRCEVCDRSTDLQEVLESNTQPWLKQHTVCSDHASFRGDWDVAGEVIGVNFAGAVDPELGSSGIGYAIPSDVVRDIVPELIEHGSVARASIGVSITARSQKKESGFESRLQIVKVSSTDSPLKQGDLIISVNGQSVHRRYELMRLLNRKAIDATLSIEIMRSGSIQQVEVRATARPPRPQVDATDSSD